MGRSAAGKMQREQMKRAYKQFSKAWRNERAYQAWAKDNGQKLSEDAVALGRRPTFEMWMRAVKNKLDVEAADNVEKKLEEDSKIDLGWEDDVKKENVNT